MHVELIEFVQRFHPPWFVFFAKCLNFLDRGEFYFFLILVIWLGWGMRAGLRLFYVLSISHLVNVLLKALFALPRPFHVTPSLGLVEVAGFGFPSGGAQSAFLLGGLWILYTKGRQRFWVGGGYIALISFSRIYLGVHYPEDVVGGWVVGAVLLGLYQHLLPKIEKVVRVSSPKQIFWSTLAIAGALSFVFPFQPVWQTAAVAIGFNTGSLLGKERKGDRLWIDLLMGLAGSAALIGWVHQAKIADKPEGLIALVILGLWVSWGVGLLKQKIYTKYQK